MSNKAHQGSISDSTHQVSNHTPKRKVWIASDHAGFELKRLVIELFGRLGCYDVFDEGPYQAERVDYPQYAWPLTLKVAESISRGEDGFGILICGTGIGVSLVANQHPDIRAALAHNLFTAEMARRHNNAQILCLGARVIGQDLALAMVEIFALTPFDGGRHEDRLQLMRELSADV